MTVAIYTDASIYRGIGAWATVIIVPGGEPVEAAGPLRGRFRSSAAVEGAAIANALWFAKRHGLIEAGETVIVRGDNRAIIDRLRGEIRKAAKDPAIMAATDYVREVARTLGLNLTAEWVKGHQRLDSRDPHAIHNRRCDQLCGAAREGRAAPSIRMLHEQHAAAQRRRDKREALGVWGEPHGPRGEREAAK